MRKATQYIDRIIEPTGGNPMSKRVLINIATAIALLISMALTGCSTLIHPELDSRYETLLMKSADVRAGVRSRCTIRADRYLYSLEQQGLAGEYVVGYHINDYGKTTSHAWVEFEQDGNRYVVETTDPWIYKNPGNYKKTIQEVMASLDKTPQS